MMMMRRRRRDEEEEEEDSDGMRDGGHNFLCWLQARPMTNGS